LANIVIEQSNNCKAKQESLLAQKLKDTDKELLAKLIDFEKKEEQAPYKRYRITLLKKFYQSTKLNKIKANVFDLAELQGYHNQVDTILKSIGLTP
jgi:hypothetical protein